MTSQKSFFVLSMDGGGARGFSTLVILNEMEQKVRQKVYELTEKEPDRESIRVNFRIVDCFDLISGTSCGALFACTLTDKVANRTVEDAMRIFEQQCATVFKRSLWHKIKTGFGLWGPIYSRDILSKSVRELLGNQRLSELSPPVLVPTFDLVEEKPKLFMTSCPRLHYRMAIDDDYFVHDVLMAATAIPVFFPAMQVTSCDRSKTSTFCDGGLFLNHPGVMALSIMKSQAPEVDNIHVVSIGTGKSKEKMNYLRFMNNAGIVEATWVLIALLFYGQEDAADAELTRLLSMQDSKCSRYVRFQPRFDAKDAGLGSYFDASHIPAFRKAALETVVGNPDFDPLINELAANYLIKSARKL